MTFYTLDEVTDKFIGKRGTPKRKAFERELKEDLMRDEIKQQSHLRGIMPAKTGKFSRRRELAD